MSKENEAPSVREKWADSKIKDILTKIDPTSPERDTAFQHETKGDRRFDSFIKKNINRIGEHMGEIAPGSRSKTVLDKTLEYALSHGSEKSVKLLVDTAEKLGIAGREQIYSEALVFGTSRKEPGATRANHYLVEKGADIDYNGGQPLGNAQVCGNTEMKTFLLNKGADVTLPSALPAINGLPDEKITNLVKDGKLTPEIINNDNGALVANLAVKGRTTAVEAMLPLANEETLKRALNEASGELKDSDGRRVNTEGLKKTISALTEPVFQGEAITAERANEKGIDNFAKLVNKGTYGEIAAEQTREAAKGDLAKMNARSAGETMMEAALIRSGLGASLSESAQKGLVENFGRQIEAKFHDKPHALETMNKGMEDQLTKMLGKNDFQGKLEDFTKNAGNIGKAIEEAHSKGADKGMKNVSEEHGAAQRGSVAKSASQSQGRGA